MRGEFGRLKNSAIAARASTHSARVKKGADVHTRDAGRGEVTVVLARESIIGELLKQGRRSLEIAIQSGVA